MHVTCKARVHKVWVHRVWHTNSSTRNLSTRSWVHNLSTQSWHTKFINEFSVNESTNNIHINVYRHANIHKRIRDVGWVVEKKNAESLRCDVSGPVSPSSWQGVWPFSQNLHAFFSANLWKGGSQFCQLDRLVKWNSFDDRDSSRGDKRRYFWLMDLILRSAIPLSVNLNGYATKVATHIKVS